jgi:hypothetical protein
LGPVDLCWFSALIFEFPLPNLLDDFSELFATLFGGYKVRSTDKYINIVVHTPI